MSTASVMPAIISTITTDCSGCCIASTGVLVVGALSVVDFMVVLDTVVPDPVKLPPEVPPAGPAGPAKPAVNELPGFPGN